jgi:hypothetical protein
LELKAKKASGEQRAKRARPEPLELKAKKASREQRVIKANGANRGSLGGLDPEA